MISELQLKISPCKPCLLEMMGLILNDLTFEKPVIIQVI